MGKTTSTGGGGTGSTGQTSSTSSLSIAQALALGLPPGIAISGTSTGGGGGGSTGNTGKGGGGGEGTGSTGGSVGQSSGGSTGNTGKGGGGGEGTGQKTTSTFDETLVVRDQYGNIIKDYNGVASQTAKEVARLAIAGGFAGTPQHAELLRQVEDAQIRGYSAARQSGYSGTFSQYSAEFMEKNFGELKKEIYDYQAKKTEYENYLAQQAELEKQQKALMAQSKLKPAEQVRININEEQANKLLQQANLADAYWAQQGQGISPIPSGKYTKTAQITDLIKRINEQKEPLYKIGADNQLYYTTLGIDAVRAGISIPEPSTLISAIENNQNLSTFGFKIQQPVPASQPVDIIPKPFNFISISDEYKKLLENAQTYDIYQETSSGNIYITAPDNPSNLIGFINAEEGKLYKQKEITAYVPLYSGFVGGAPTVLGTPEKRYVPTEIKTWTIFNLKTGEYEFNPSENDLVYYYPNENKLTIINTELIEKQAKEQENKLRSINVYETEDKKITGSFPNATVMPIIIPEEQKIKFETNLGEFKEEKYKPQLNPYLNTAEDIEKGIKTVYHATPLYPLFNTLSTGGEAISTMIDAARARPRQLSEENNLKDLSVFSVDVWGAVASIPAGFLKSPHYLTEEIMPYGLSRSAVAIKTAASYISPPISTLNKITGYEEDLTKYAEFAQYETQNNLQKLSESTLYASTPLMAGAFKSIPILNKPISQLGEQTGAELALKGIMGYSFAVEPEYTAKITGVMFIPSVARNMPLSPFAPKISEVPYFEGMVSQLSTRNLPRDVANKIFFGTEYTNTGKPPDTIFTKLAEKIPETEGLGLGIVRSPPKPPELNIPKIDWQIPNINVRPPQLNIQSIEMPMGEITTTHFVVGTPTKTYSKLPEAFYKQTDAPMDKNVADTLGAGEYSFWKKIQQGRAEALKTTDYERLNTFEQGARASYYSPEPPFKQDIPESLKQTEWFMRDLTPKARENLLNELQALRHQITFYGATSLKTTTGELRGASNTDVDIQLRQTLKNMLSFTDEETISARIAKALQAGGTEARVSPNYKGVVEIKALGGKDKGEFVKRFDIHHFTGGALPEDTIQLGSGKGVGFGLPPKPEMLTPQGFYIMRPSEQVARYLSSAQIPRYSEEIGHTVGGEPKRTYRALRQIKIQGKEDENEFLAKFGRTAGKYLTELEIEYMKSLPKSPSASLQTNLFSPSFQPSKSKSLSPSSIFSPSISPPSISPPSISPPSISPRSISPPSISPPSISPPSISPPSISPSPSPPSISPPSISPPSISPPSISPPSISPPSISPPPPPTFNPPAIPNISLGGQKSGGGNRGKISKRAYSPDVFSSLFGVKIKGKPPASVGIGIRPIYIGDNPAPKKTKITSLFKPSIFKIVPKYYKRRGKK